MLIPGLSAFPRLFTWAAVLCLGLLSVKEGRAHAAPPESLRSVAQIRAQGSWDPLVRHPVRVEGLVTHVDPLRHLLVLQDQTGALAFDLGEDMPKVQVGQSLVLEAGEAWPYVNNLARYPDRPDTRERLPKLEWEQAGEGGFFIARYRGWLYAPRAGKYRFFVASDDSSLLLLGRDATASSRRVIASVASYTRPRDWTRTVAQHSEEIELEAGRPYYIEVVHHQASGPAHLSVAWEGPEQSCAVIEGKYLEPWEVGTGDSEPKGQARGGILRELWKDVPLLTPEEMLSPRSLDSVLSVRGVKFGAPGAGRLPEPVQIKVGQSLGVEQNFLWSEVEGTVVFVGAEGDKVSMELAEGGQTMELLAPSWKQSNPATLRGRRIRVIGVVEATLTRDGQRVAGRLWLRASDGVVFTPHAPQAEVARLSKISEFQIPGQEGLKDTAVKVRGRVVSVQGNQVTISDDGVFYGFISEDGKKWSQVGSQLENEMPSRVYVGFAVNSIHPHARTRAVFSQAEGFSGPLSSIDIGNPALPGKVEISNGKYLVDGVGTDIWDSPDQFTFVYEPVEGSCSITAKLESFDYANPRAKAGLMIRESLGPEGQFVDLVSTTDVGTPATSLQWRRAMEGSSTRLANDYSRKPGTPLWLKLERRYSKLAVLANEAVLVEPGELVDVVGYSSFRDGKALIEGASLFRTQRPAGGAQAQRDWRPLVDLSQINDGSGRWGGFDIFRLRGVVTFCGEVSGRQYLVFQDRSAAALLTPRESSGLFKVRPGSLVEIFGNPGWYAPSDILYADNVFELGTASPPTPIKHPAEYLLPRRGEGTWIELEGLVRSVSPAGVLEVKARGDLFNVVVAGAQREQLARLVDAEVRIRGAITYPSELERLLLVPSASCLEVQVAPAADPFSGPVEKLSSFNAERLVNQSRHRVRVSGVITLAEAGVIYLQDAGGGARLELESTVNLKVGTAVTALGFPDWGAEHGLVLRHTLLRPLAEAVPMEPVVLRAEEAARGAHYQRLVRVKATVAKTWGAGDGELLELQVDKTLFHVTFPRHSLPGETLPAGTLVEVTGVNARELGTHGTQFRPGAMLSALPLRLLPRGASDLVVLQKPSWWVLRRTLVVAALVVLAILVSVIWIQLLRRRVRLRTEELAATMDKLQKEARMSATLAERDRLAGEIHDSLEQGLNGIIYHLECTSNLGTCSDEVRRALELACSMASFSRTEVQYAVWELQSPMLEDSDLRTAIEKISGQIAPESLTAKVLVTGDQRRLSSEIEHHLLRVVQEALNNIVKHAKATKAELLLNYGQNSVEVLVTDNGCGFDPDKVRTGGLGHFGLRSLKSRVAKIGGRLEVASQPGKGTVLRVTVPINSL